jgi:nitrate reductase assembly molybdenum cofactor insertion protein NarJ
MNQNHLSHYGQLADLLRYPDHNATRSAVAARDSIADRYPDAAATLGPFIDFFSSNGLTTQEELFTRSFDVQSITTLDIGYVLFGDDYKRGEVLVHLNREHHQVGNDCRNELADHLPAVLCLLPKMLDAELRAELVEKMIIPALEKILSEFNPDRIASKKKVYLKHHKTIIESSEHYGLLYRKPLEAIMLVLRQDFGVPETPKDELSSEFLRNIGTEMTLEAG